MRRRLFGCPNPPGGSTTKRKHSPRTFTGRPLGRWGERRAVQHLRAAGCGILAVNWTTSRGEIDIVARSGDTLIFIEVKTRSADVEALFGPLRAVDEKKRRKLVTVACDYRARYRRRLERIGIRRSRFDVVTCIYRGPWRAPDVRHYQGAFEAHRYSPTERAFVPLFSG